MAGTVPFRLRVEGVFDISSRGTAVLGVMLGGELSMGDLDDGLPRVGLIVPAWSNDDIVEGDVLVAAEQP